MSLLSAFVFPVPKPTYDVHSFPGELLWIPHDLDYRACKPRDCIPAVFLQSPNARYLVLYLHTNGEDLGCCYAFAAGLRMVLEVHVLVVEYPGYGICPGESSEESLHGAAEAAFRFIEEALHWPPQDIILLGRSLGGALAIRLARRHTCHGLLLVAPFLSLADAAAGFIGNTFAKAVVGGMFSNRTHIPGVKVPTMIIHGEQDRLVPCSHGRELYRLIPHGKKQLVCPEMGHNADLLCDPTFLVRPMFGFFALPDYNFEELRVPLEAFDKRLGQQPIERQQDKCPGCWQNENAISGPRTGLLGISGSPGDKDGLDGSLNFAVRHRYVWMPPGDNTVQADTSPAAGLDLPSMPATVLRPTKVPPKPTECIITPCLSREETLAAHLPGLSKLDIDEGITRFLQERSSARIMDIDMGISRVLQENSGRSVRESV